MTSQPRWPAGAPDDEHGHGQGGRFAPIGTPGTGGWLRQIGARLDRGWANDSLARDDLAAIAHSHPTQVGEVYGGSSLSTVRYDLPDGRSVIHKMFGDEHDADANTRSEVLVSRIAEVVGARVPPAIVDPDYPTEVWMGYVDGDFLETPDGDPLGGWEDAQQILDALSPEEQDAAYRLGLLDLLVGNEDRNDTNWLVDTDGRLYGIDHAMSGLFHGVASLPRREDALHAHGPFATLYLRSPVVTAIRDHPLHPADLDAVVGGLRGLFDYGYLSFREFEYMHAVLERLRPHAKGTRRLIPG